MQVDLFCDEALAAVDENDHYGMLSTASGDKLNASSSDQQLRAAFRTAARLLHPDRLPPDSKLGNDGWNRVRTAFLVLTDGARRARYDAGEQVGLEDICVSAEDELDTLPIDDRREGASLLQKQCRSGGSRQQDQSFQATDQGHAAQAQGQPIRGHELHLQER